MSSTATAAPPGADLTTCDREPIHAPGAIQPHGYLIAAEGPDWAVRRVSANVPGWLGRPAGDLLGRPLEAALGAAAFQALRAALEAARPGEPPAPAGVVPLARGAYEALVHRAGAVAVLEFEPAGPDDGGRGPGSYSGVRAFLEALDSGTTVDDLTRHTVFEVRRLTGFDRALIYRFDEDGHGSVIAEDRNDALPSYLGLRFPASDVPRQARELYRLNRARLIPDAGYEPVPLLPADAPPLDLTFAGLRSVAPVHVEYMRNMGTGSSMSVSVVRDGKLWGLISCHGKAPRAVPYGARAACELLGQIFALHLTNLEHKDEYEHRHRLTTTQAALIASLAGRDDFVAGLGEHASDLLAFAGATGGAVLFEGRCTRWGVTPGEPDVRAIADWLGAVVRRDVFATRSLAEHLPWAASVKAEAAGLLAVSISKLHRNYLMWFRPEVVSTVHWAGDPGKHAPAAGGRIEPRKSFEAWAAQVRLRANPWRRSEVEGAAGLRNAIVGVVLRKAEELAALNAELTRSNEELEAFSYSVSHDLRAPFRHIAGYAELLRDREGASLDPTTRRYVETIIESAEYAGRLVDNLLGFSKMGRADLAPVSIDMNGLVAETVRKVGQANPGRRIDWRVGSLPPAWGDLMMLRLVVENLLSNAVKYSKGRSPAVIAVTGVDRGDEVAYTVTDNGVGFDMKYADKLFGVFQRLHRMEDYEGTGIGLANVRRILARHGGRAWAEGVVDSGATFSFALPKAGDVAAGGTTHA